jgi:hypothetical protein
MSEIIDHFWNNISIYLNFLLLVAVYFLVVRIGQLHSVYENKVAELRRFESYLDERNEEDYTRYVSEYDKLGDEEEGDYANTLIKISAICKISKTHSEYLLEPDNFDSELVDYERGVFENRLFKAMALLGGIHDEFYSGSAIYHIVGLLVEVGELDRAKELFSEVRDSLLREQVLKDYGDVLGAE